MFQGKESPVTRLRLVLTWLFVITFAVGGNYVVCYAGHHFNWSTPVFFAAVTGFWWFYSFCMATWIIPVYRHAQKGYLATEAAQMPPVPISQLRYATVVAGTHIMMFWGMIRAAWGNHDSLGLASVIGLATALGVANFFHYRGRNGRAMGPIYMQQLASCGLVMLVIINLRFDVWVARIYGVSVADLPKLVPTWMIPALSLVLVLWSVSLLFITKPKAPSMASAR